MKRLALFMLFSIALQSYSLCQTKIYLLPPKPHRGNYQFVNPSDSAYISMSHSEDMGVWYARRYELRTDIPDGKYEIYVSDTLALSASIKDFKKDGIWTAYYRNGQILSITPYKDGKINGEDISYHHNGVVSYRAKYEDGKTDIEYRYDLSGKVWSKAFYVNGEFIRQDIFEEDGSVKSHYPGGS